MDIRFFRGFSYSFTERMDWEEAVHLHGGPRAWKNSWENPRNEHFWSAFASGLYIPSLLIKKTTTTAKELFLNPTSQMRDLNGEEKRQIGGNPAKKKLNEP